VFRKQPETNERQEGADKKSTKKNEGADKTRPDADPHVVETLERTTHRPGQASQALEMLAQESGDKYPEGNYEIPGHVFENLEQDFAQRSEEHVSQPPPEKRDPIDKLLDNYADTLRQQGIAQPEQIVDLYGKDIREEIENNNILMDQVNERLQENPSLRKYYNGIITKFLVSLAISAVIPAVTGQLIFLAPALLWQAVSLQAQLSPEAREKFKKQIELQKQRQLQAPAQSVRKELEGTLQQLDDEMKKKSPELTKGLPEGALEHMKRKNRELAAYLYGKLGFNDREIKDMLQDYSREDQKQSIPGGKQAKQPTSLAA